MYQVCPGDGQFILTTPLFDTVKLNFESGKSFTIYTKPLQNDAKYISSATLNGVDYKKSFIPYKSIMKGGELKYSLSAEHIGDWGTGDNIPVDSIPVKVSIVPIPYSEPEKLTFTDSVLVRLKSYFPGETIMYTDECPGCTSVTRDPVHYTSPFVVTSSDCIVSWAEDKSLKTRSGENKSCFIQIPEGRKIKVVPKPDNQYTAGGPEALIDGQHGVTNFHLGKWTGYQGQDFEAVVDLGDIQNVKSVHAEFLLDQNSWVFLPQYVDIYLSDDSIHFNRIAHIDSYSSKKDPNAELKNIGLSNINKHARYVKVFAKQFGKLPSWHDSSGEDSWLFIDEIDIK
jgi:hypothetical protein